MADFSCPIDLDYSATTPHAPEVIDAIRPCLEEHFGNPSSSHVYGRKSHWAIENRVAASAGAACHSGQVRISHVLEAMPVPEDWARETLRFSTGRMTAENDVRTAADVVATAIDRLTGCG